ncbi:hypothetical protein FPOAC2_07598 [Fusarium poae]|uniref:hypothetical protein n=1 Tax=Fusarium poae TaxID=36050 RepID=UPI001CE90AF6|nr:hypothetical protein FPOAC1_007673 [Fusarium poae]KAG8668294.1 hypothetical protein FPOAC1_007673 [Fusarium poae]
MTSHWCDSFYFELVGTDCWPQRLEERQRSSFQLSKFNEQAVGCKFCSKLADLIAYRLQCNSAFTNGDDATTHKVPIVPEDANLYISHEVKEVRNWSFGFEGVTSRKIVVIGVAIGTKHMEIILQRSGTGGRVPVEFSSDGLGSDGVTFQPPGTWRVDPPGLEYQWQDFPGKDIAKLEPTFGRPRPLLVDFSMIREWIRTCDQQHPICQHDGVLVDIPQFRLIDVERMCIVQVDVSKRPPFATLSYVWGNKPFLRLVKANIKDLQLPGNLEKLTLPSTIIDAMAICAKLQIGHIWIDSLCIIQDDESDMIQVIDKMDTIYRESILTIVAASGIDAHSGIPGIRTGTRSLEQHPLEIRGVGLIDSVDTGQFRFQGPFQEPLWISNTPWAQRAWTFQEALVSRRSLFFTAEQVYWSCREGLLSEDTTEHFRNNESPYVPKKRLDSNFDPQSYLKLATTFSTRRLTYEADIGRAFLGAQKHLDRKWGGHKFSWGLPHGSFGSFLMWERPAQEDRRIRIGTHPIRQRDGSIVQVPFPSWSWMGWTDGGKLVSFYGDEPKPHSPTFYVFDSAAELMEVCDEFTLPSPLRDLLVGDSNVPTEVTEAQLPQELHLTPSIRHSALIFYTEVATVKYNPSLAFKADSVLDIPSDLKMRSFEYPFSIQIGNTYHRIVEQDQDDESKDLEEIDLVATSIGTPEDFEVYDRF